MILIVGPPGSGKSVQAGMIEDEANVKWLSIGKLLRELATDEQKERMNQGVLLDDLEVEDILADAIHEVSNGTRILIDGFPRRQSQVDWFRGYTKAARRNLEAIIHMKVSQDEVVRRLGARGRSDDDADITRKRYELYEAEIVPVLESLGTAETKLIEVDGEQTVDEIHSYLTEQLKGIV